ncbi:hypothetical protein C3B78_03615 [Arthrobacter sp. PGP41]|nr:hypothetical protein C3B78_03615 [Arthrobacter sp. PGP41]
MRVAVGVSCPPGISPVTPTNVSTFSPSVKWTEADYATFITGSQARRLAAAGVAPLVAQARGYLVIDDSNHRELYRQMGLQGRSRLGLQLTSAIAQRGGEGLMIPRFTPSAIQWANRDGATPAPSYHEVLPSLPWPDASGKRIASVTIPNFSGQLDLHPAIPTDWIDSDGTILICNDAAEADAVLSAYLLHAGTARAELTAVEPLVEGGPTDPTADLHALLARISEKDRILVLAASGFGQMPWSVTDLNEIRIKRRDILLAVPTETESSEFVHRNIEKFAEALKNKKAASVLYLAPKRQNDADDEAERISVADLLAAKAWPALIDALQNTLPAGSVVDAAVFKGAVRVSPDGHTIEECIAVNGGPSGTNSSLQWATVVRLGGRIKTMETRRQPTDKELRTGTFDATARSHDGADSMVEIEVSWKRDGKEGSGVITGPSTILHHQPQDWIMANAKIPNNVLLHPNWPPRKKQGEQFLEAIKTNRPEETKKRTRWQQMGWVPVDGSAPVFIVGDQVIGETVEGTTAAGVDSQDIPVADLFGVGVSPLGDDLKDEAVRESARQDLRDIMSTYITAGAWKDRSTAALVLAGALRPTIPLRPRATIFLWGPKGRGKTWTAKAMMYFWAKGRSTWLDQLPGSAKDTIAYIETCVSRTPIWVVDDLAPSPVKRQAEAEDGKLADLTRSIFNNSTKGRMNADMSTRKVNKPVAQLIITAENELTTPSAKERLIPAYLGYGSLAGSRVPTDAINELAKRGVPARFTGHFIRFIRQTAITTPGGWEAFFEGLEDRRADVQKSIEAIMKSTGKVTGSLERTSSLAADVLLTFEVLQLFAEELDMGKELRDLFDLETGMGRDIITVVASAQAENTKASPGAALVRALSALLASGGAHVINAQNPSAPPLEGTEDSDALANHRLGWSAGPGADGKLSPNGPSIGTVVTKDGQKIIVFEVETAFAKAQAAYPALIQHGQGTGSAWASIWDEKLSPASITRPTNSRGAVSNTVRLTSGSGSSRVRPSGVPITVDTILVGGNDGE